MNDWMCLPSLTASQVNLSITFERGAEFQMETLVNCRRGFSFSDYENFDDFTLLFFRGRRRKIRCFKTRVLSSSAH